jgi:hypothetical protein
LAWRLTRRSSFSVRSARAARGLLMLLAKIIEGSVYVRTMY